MKKEKEKEAKKRHKKFAAGLAKYFFSYRVWAKIKIFYGREKKLCYQCPMSTTTVLVSLVTNTRKYKQSKETKKWHKGRIPMFDHPLAPPRRAATVGPVSFGTVACVGMIEAMPLIPEQRHCKPPSRLLPTVLW